MKALFRELTPDEVDFVAGGNYIWVNGPYMMSRSEWYGGAWDDSDYGGYDTRETGVPAGGWYPEGFDYAQDRAADALATWLHGQIVANPDKTHEYGAYIYSVNGVVYSTALIKGTANETFVKLDANGNAVIDPSTGRPVGLTWAEMGVPANAVIVGAVHSHPSLSQNVQGSPPVPSHPDGWAPSDGDMIGMQTMVTSGQYNVDPVNYRIYISFGNDITEFYSSHQSYNLIGSSPNATWATPAPDENW